MYYNIFFKRVIHWYLSRMLGKAVRDIVQKDEYDKEVHVRNGSYYLILKTPLRSS